MKHIPTLDGWRGLAILLVLIDHMTIYVNGRPPFPWLLHLGQHGVAVFFVLSGFLITSRLLEEHQQTGRVDLRNFYARRFFRLMPAAWCYLALIGLVLVVTHRADHLRDIVACVFFYRNYVHDGLLLTGHFWSLSIEEQYYLVWPAVLLFTGPRRATWVAIAGALAVAAFRFTHWTYFNSVPIADSLVTQLRADALLVGCVAALTIHRFKAVCQKVPAFVFLPLVCWCVMRYHQLIPLHESLLIALLMMGTVSQPASLLARILESRPLVLLGKLSYSIYLWQQCFHALTDYRQELAWWLPLPAVAIISYHFIERPGREFGRRLLHQSAPPA